MRLYDLAGQYNDLLDLLQDDTDNEQLHNMLNGLEGAIEEKIENIAKVMKTLEVESKGYDEEIKRLSARKKSADNNFAYLKGYLEDTLRFLGTEKVKGRIFTVSLQSNAPSLEVIDEFHIPQTYFKPQPPALDRRKLLDDVKSGAYNNPNVVALKQTKSLRVR